MLNKLFVYGTLKSETHKLDELIGVDNFKVIGWGTIKAHKLSGTQYPAVIPGETDEILGEVIELKNIEHTIIILDQYEEYDPQAEFSSLYIRNTIKVILNTGEEQLAWIYFYNI